MVGGRHGPNLVAPDRTLPAHAVAWVDLPAAPPFGPVPRSPVIAGLAWTVSVLALVSMCWGLLTAVLDQPPGKAQLLYAAGLEVVVLVQSVVGLVRLAGGFRPVETATTIGYLVGIVVLLPVAWFWANSERTRFSGIVLAVAAAAVAAVSCCTPAARRRRPA